MGNLAPTYHYRGKLAKKTGFLERNSKEHWDNANSRNATMNSSDNAQ